MTAETTAKATTSPAGTSRARTFGSGAERATSATTTNHVGTTDIRVSRMDMTITSFWSSRGCGAIAGCSAALPAVIGNLLHSNRPPPVGGDRYVHRCSTARSTSAMVNGGPCCRRSVSTICGGNHLVYRLGPHECSVRRAQQELGVDERTDQRIALGTIQAPQPLRLRRRQAESGHLEVFAPNTPKDALKRLIRCWLRQ